MFAEVKEQSKYFLKNIPFMGALIVSAIVGYAYVLTHGTCGIDDISIDLYFKNGIGVAIGRWPYYLINKIIPIAEYTPFWGDLITIVLLMLAAIAWCVLLRILISSEVSIWCYVIFVFLFMDYSMNADVFVFYLQNGLGWVHLFSVMSLIAFLYIYKNKPILKTQILIRLGIIVMMTLAISFYESAANIFLTGVMLIIFVDLYRQKEESCFHGKGFVTAIFFAGRYLVYAMAARRVIRTIIMRVFDIPAYTFYRSPSSIEWIIKGGMGEIWNNIKCFLAQIYCNYFAMSVTYYPAFLFLVCSIVFLLLLLYCIWQKRDLLLGIAGVGMYLSMFALCVIQGDAMQYRACQIFTIFVAFIFFVIAIILMKTPKYIQVCGGVILICAILYSVYDMNQWFILDYDKTEYEMQVIDQIAEELNSGKYNVQEKPLVVVGGFELPDEIYDRYCITDEDFGWNIVENAVKAADREIEDKYCYGQNAGSIIDWSVNAFAMYCGYNIPVKQLFEYCGYDEFMWADSETKERVFATYYPLDWEYYSYTYIEIYTENYGDTAQYPETGYIEETDDCIIIRL